VDNSNHLQNSINIGQTWNQYCNHNVGDVAQEMHLGTTCQIHLHVLAQYVRNTHNDVDSNVEKASSWESGESGGESGAILFTIGYGKYFQFNNRLVAAIFYCKAFHCNWWTHNVSLDNNH
jgi:hypothetical protein